jgi:WD40 repeat protein
MARRSLSIFAVFLLAAPAAAQPRVDSLGDPLPPGAIARLGTLRMQHEDATVLSAAIFSADSATVFSAAGDSPIVRAWDAATGKERRRFVVPTKDSSYYITLAASPDGKLLAAANKAHVHLWDTATGKWAGTFDGPDGTTFNDVAFQDGGKTLVAANDFGAIFWWDVAQRRETARWLPWEAEARVEMGITYAPGFAQARFSADGRWLAVERIFGPPQKTATMAVLDLAGRKERWRVTCEGSPLFAFAPNGRRLALTVQPNVVEVRDVTTGAQLAARQLEQASKHARVHLLAFTADGGSVAFTCHNDDSVDASLQLWSLDDTTQVRTLPIPGPVCYTRLLAFAADNRSVLTVLDNRLYLSDVATGAPLCPRAGHRSMVYGVAFAADGRSLRSYEFPLAREEVLTWDTVTWKQKTPAPVRLSWPAGRVALSADETRAIVAGWGRWDVVEHPGGKLLGTLKPPAAKLEPRFGGFSEHGTLCYAGAYAPGTYDVTMAFYEAATGKLRFHYALTEQDYSWVCAPDDRLLARCFTDGSIQVLDAADGKLVRTVGNRRKAGPATGAGTGYQVEFAPGGKVLAQWDERHAEMGLWNLATGKELWTLPQARSEPWVRLAWSPDGRTLAVAGGDAGHGIQLVEAETGKVRHTYRGHTAPVRCLAWSPDGRLLASGSADTTVLVWDVWGTMPLTQ